MLSSAAADAGYPLPGQLLCIFLPAMGEEKWALVHGKACEAKVTPPLSEGRASRSSTLLAEMDL